MSIDLSQRNGRDIKINRLVHIRHASTTVHEYSCLKKRSVSSSKSIIREKVNVVVSKLKNNYFVKIEHP